MVLHDSYSIRGWFSFCQAGSFIDRRAKSLRFPIGLHDSYRWFCMIHTASGGCFSCQACFFIDMCAKSLLFPTISKVLPNSCRFWCRFLSAKPVLLVFTTFLQGFRGSFFFLPSTCPFASWPQHKACYMVSKMT